MSLPLPPLEQPGDPPRIVTLDELDRVYPLSPDTRRWLANTSITVERVNNPRMAWYRVRMQFPHKRGDGFVFSKTP
jgi:hypothetical protein